jgi:hypothetical protein
MRTALAIGIAAIVGTAIAASSAEAAPAGNSAPCSAMTTKIDGGPAVTYCGPATATLVVAGKRYSFKDGYCQAIKVSGIKLDVTLGTFVEGASGAGVPGNAGKPSFRLDVSPGLFSSLMDSAFSGGKKVSDGGSVIPSGSVTSKGTFKSMKSAAVAFSGSWNCHGTFVTH